MSCGLAVLLIRTHDALAANRKKSKSFCGQASFTLDLETELSFPQNNTRFAFYEDGRLCNGVYSELQYLQSQQFFSCGKMGEIIGEM